MQEPIKLQFTPAYILEYVRNWAKHAKKEKGIGAAEVAMIDDIVTLVEVAKNCLNEEPEQIKS